MGLHQWRGLSVSVILATFFSLSSVAACGSEPSATAVKMAVGNTYEQMNAEFQAEKSALSLPPGAQWPARAKEAGPTDRYGKGYGTSQADQLWYCSWAREWLTKRAVSVTDSRTALTQLKLVKQTALYRVGFDPGVQDQTDQEISAAENDDPTVLASSVKQNC